MSANRGAINLLAATCAVGAEAWWFDGHRESAFAAWKAENAKNSARQQWPDRLWYEVVAVINANYPAIKQFFGANMMRTIEAGSVHIPPAETFRVMFGHN